jgi:uncharacterized protein (TIRG00374 family)
MLTKILRIIIGIGLAYGLIHVTLKSTGGDIWNEILQAQKPFLLLSLLIYGGASVSLPVYRWMLLLKVQGIKPQGWELIRLTMIGGFFNMVLPGAVSGDLIKMIFVAKQTTQEKRAEAILTVILDRILGLLGLFIIAAIMVLFYLPFLLDLKHAYRPIQVAALTVCLVSICGISGLVIIWFRQTLKRYLGIDQIVKFLKRKLPKSIVSIFIRLMNAPVLIRLMNAFDLYRRNLDVIAIGIVLSILIHLCLAVILFLVGVSIGENGLRVSDYFLSTQVGSAIAIIPLTPGGIGLRDATIAAFLSALHATPEKIGVLPVIMTLVIASWQLIGGLVFIFSKFPKTSFQSTVVVNHKKSSQVSLDVE